MLKKRTSRRDPTAGYAELDKMLRKYFHIVRKTCVRPNHASKGPCWCCSMCPGHFSVCQIKEFFILSAELACFPAIGSAFQCSMRMATTLPLPKKGIIFTSDHRSTLSAQEKMSTETSIVIRNLEMKSTKHESNLNFSTGTVGYIITFLVIRIKGLLRLEKVNVNQLPVLTAF